jgi:hypothetical protein
MQCLFASRACLAQNAVDNVRLFTHSRTPPPIGSGSPPQDGASRQGISSGTQSRSSSSRLEWTSASSSPTPSHGCHIVIKFQIAVVQGRAPLRAPISPPTARALAEAVHEQAMPFQTTPSPSLLTHPLHAAPTIEKTARNRYHTPQVYCRQGDGSRHTPGHWLLPEGSSCTV